MTTLREKAADFLAQKSIAVAGVSRSPRGKAANMVYRKLRGAGYQVFPVNPNAAAVEGDPCYPDLRSVPAPVDGVVIATRPQVADDIVRQCGELDIPRVWMHRALGAGSVSESATEYCRDNDIAVIPGGCPLMFCPPVDLAHRCLRWVLGAAGRLPD